MVDTRVSFGKFTIPRAERKRWSCMQSRKAGRQEAGSGFARSIVKLHERRDGTLEESWYVAGRGLGMIS